MIFPDKKKFAFTIFDDTDFATVENVKPVYDLLNDLGIKTTKSVWVFPTPDKQATYSKSQTLAEPGYLEFIRCLVEKDFEIAFHNASGTSNHRDITLKSLASFYDLLGFYPQSFAQHHLNRENIYWGYERLKNPLLRYLMGFVPNSKNYEGHQPNSSFFWGDLCKKHILFVRNLVFREINLHKINPTLPYMDPDYPYVNFWFSSSEGGNVKNFNKLLSRENQNQLEREEGVCIVYTHFAKDFVENGKINSQTKRLLTELANRNGWFVTVSTLLNYLQKNSEKELRSNLEIFRMEFRWFISKLIHGTS